MGKWDLATRMKVYEMMTEPAARMLGDSSGIYGTVAQRRASMMFDDFAGESRWYMAEVEVIDGLLVPSIYASMFHWLSDNLIFDLRVSNPFWEELLSLVGEDDVPGADAGEIVFAKKRGWGNYSVEKRFGTINTYNFDTYLNGVCEYTQYGELVLLRTHNGADVRSGYSSPVLFIHQNSSNPLLPPLYRDRVTFHCGSHWWDVTGSRYESNTDCALPLADIRLSGTHVPEIVLASDDEAVARYKSAVEERANRVYVEANGSPLFGLEQATHALHPPMMLVDEEALRIYCPVCGNELVITGGK